MAAKRKPVSSRSITAAQVDKFFAVFAATANVSRAAKAAKIYRQWAYEQREKDENFAARWKEAEEIACDALEEEARRRALKGVIKPVYQQGKRVGFVKEYSDTLMVILLKAHRPEKFKDKAQVEHNHTGAVGLVLEIQNMTDEQLRAELERLENERVS